MSDLDRLTASHLVSAATLAALVARLKRIGVLIPEDEREIYEHALRLLKEQAAASPEEMAGVFDAARETIEAQPRL